MAKLLIDPPVSGVVDPRVSEALDLLVSEVAVAAAAIEAEVEAGRQTLTRRLKNLNAA